MDAAKSSLRSRNLDLNQVYNPESRAKIHFRSIFVGQNPFFDLKCPVLIRKIDLLSRLWFKSLRLASIYFRFLKNGLCLVHFMAV